MLHITQNGSKCSDSESPFSRISMFGLADSADVSTPNIPKVLSMKLHPPSPVQECGLWEKMGAFPRHEIEIRLQVSKKKGGYSRVTISPAAKKRANFHVLSFKEPRSLTFSKWYLPRRSFTLLHQGLGFQEKCVDLSLDMWASAVGILPFRILTMSLAQNFVQ